ncbi:MAG: DciA family protein [Planctomycetota bacterium]|nr:DciA family protein [Planctomycetota bacterium]MDA1105343.1 DciA family protein [Planctomycetota bacterium]
MPDTPRETTAPEAGGQALTPQDRAAQYQLAQLQRWRGGTGRREPAPLSEEWKRIGAQVRRDHKRVGSVVEAWELCVPEALREHCRVDGYARGVLTVAVESAPARFELDRALRGGLDGRLRQLLGTAFQRVRCVSAPIDPVAGA